MDSGCNSSQSSPNALVWHKTRARARVCVCVCVCVCADTVFSRACLVVHYSQGFLKDFSGEDAWQIEDLVGDLCVVQALLGKPKLLIIQACRGREFFCVVPKTFERGERQQFV